MPPEPNVYDKDSHIAMLEETNRALAMRLADLNKRMMKRHNASSLQWRNKYFYLKKKLDRLVKEGRLVENEDTY